MSPFLRRDSGSKVGTKAGTRVAFQRIEITAAIVKEAARAAAERRAGTSIWADTRLPYLQIRQRAGAAKWTVKGMKTSRAIGDVRERHPAFLSVTDARKKATDIYTKMRYGEPVPPVSADEEPTGWTLGRVCLAYQRMLSQPRWINNRLKPPSEDGNDDVRLAFAQASYQFLGAMNVLELTRPLLNQARDGVSSYRQRQKCVAYVKAALTWAADTHPDESGLVEGVERWWERLTAGDPDPDTMRAIEKRREENLQNKADLTVDAIARTLVAHEAYCVGRTAEHKISPGIRWGLWWIAFTGNRRLSTVKLAREDLLEQDPFGEDGWGRAAWPADTMKAKTPFWLPLPGVVHSIAAGSIADYTQLVANSHGDWPSRWVFASTRRYGRDANNDDVSIYPNSINRHLQRMRADGALDGLPLFNPHLVRSPVGDFIADTVSGAASSLVLAHTLKKDEKEAAVTTRQYYLTSQRMREKADGMRAWSETLVEAYLKAGGTMPAPREERCKSKLKRKPPVSQPGAIVG